VPCRTLLGMKRLSSVPEWVRPPLYAVAGTEEFLLWLFDRTRAPQALGSWSSLSWLVAAEGAQTPGPLVRRGLPTEVAAWGDMAVADLIANAEAYPPSSWWAEQGIALGDRMAREQWAERTGSLYERHYAHGVTVALAWLLGSIDDPALMAPIRDGDGEFIPPATREEYRSVLRKLSEPPPADGSRGSAAAG
jgi:hypothetical protein